MKPIPPEHRAEMVRLRQEGQTLRQIAARLGYCHASVKNFTDHVTHPRRRRASPAERAEMVRLRAKGLSCRDVAARLGYSFSAVAKWAPRPADAPRPRHGRPTIAEARQAAALRDHGFPVERIVELMGRRREVVERLLARTANKETEHARH